MCKGELVGGTPSVVCKGGRLGSLLQCVREVQWDTDCCMEGRASGSPIVVCKGGWLGHQVTCLKEGDWGIMCRV